MKKIIFFKYAVLLIVLTIIQLTIIPMVSIGSVVPNLLVIVVVIFTLQYGQFFGTIFGSITGLVFDLLSGGAIGTAMFSFTLSGFITGYFYNENKTEYNISTMFLVLIVSLVAAINSFFYMLLTSSEIKFTASYLILGQSILPGIYTGLLALPTVIYNQKRKFI